MGKTVIPKIVFDGFSPEIKKMIESKPDQYEIEQDSAKFVAENKAKDQVAKTNPPPADKPAQPAPAATQKPMTGKPANLLDTQIQKLEEKKETQGLSPEEEKKLAEMKAKLGVENEPAPGGAGSTSNAAPAPDKKKMITREIVEDWLDDDRR